MKKLIVVAALGAGGWWLYNWLQAHSTEEKIKNSAPVRYTQALHNDVQRADDAANKANTVIQQGSQDAQKVLEDAEVK